MATDVQTAKPEAGKPAVAPAVNAAQSPGQDPASSPTPNDQADQQTSDLTGRAVFAVETTAAGVVIRTAFLTQDNRLLDMPAVFPNMLYALNVIDDLRQQVIQHFSQAAQVGAQVIANQQRQQQSQQPDQSNAQAQTESQTQAPKPDGKSDQVLGKP